jgi:hypothetical protein
LIKLRFSVITRGDKVWQRAQWSSALTLLALF